MAKDPNYDRYAGIVSLPGLDGKMPRPFRVDEDGSVIYKDEELQRVARLGKDENPTKLAELGNPNWNGYEVMRAQGQRDGQTLRKGYDGFRRSAPEPILDRSQSAPLERPSIAMMTEATNDAFNTIWSGHGAPGSASSLNTEFSRMDRLPDFSKGNWKKVDSTHAPEAYEHSLPGTFGMAVKVYLKDSNHDGINTATITTPTESINHYGSWPAYKLGLPVNSRNAAMYLADRRSRKGSDK